MPAFRILTVCTGNICRSPLAQLLLARDLPDEGFGVSSAGTRGMPGWSLEEGMVPFAREWGLPWEGFRSTRLQPYHLQQADLVLTATREHRNAVLAEEPAATRRTFTLREFAGLASGIAPGLAGHPAELVDALAGVRHAYTDGLDIEDPYREAAEVYAACAESIRTATTAVARALSGAR